MEDQLHGERDFDRQLINRMGYFVLVYIYRQKERKKNEETCKHQKSCKFILKPSRKGWKRIVLCGMQERNRACYFGKGRKGKKR